MGRGGPGRSEGAWFRAQAKLHANHADTFADLFKDDQSFQSWLRAAGKQTTYAEGALIQASVEKTGSSVIVWRYKDSTWERYVLAARFSKGRACWAPKAAPHTVVLKDKHYYGACPPEGIRR